MRQHNALPLFAQVPHFFYYDANILKISESTKSEVQAKPCYGLYIKESVISRPRKAVMDCMVIILAT